MKTLKFSPKLVPLVLDGSKTSTWRLFDDKDLKVNDELEFVDSSTVKKFAHAVIIGVKEKSLAEITEADFVGHEPFASREEMLATYQGYYGSRVDWSTLVKMVSFKIVAGS